MIFGKPQDSKYKLYQDLVKSLYQNKNCNKLYETAEHLFKVEGNDQNGRTYITQELMQFLIKTMKAKGVPEEQQIELEDLLPLTSKVAELCRKNVDEFPDALMDCLHLLSLLHQANDDWQSAARALTSYKFDSRRCSATNEQKVEWFVETAELWLECEETGHAGQAIKKAHGLTGSMKDINLQLRYKTCYARILDSERKFLEAAMHYKQLSQFGAGKLSQADMLTTLEKAVNCAILGKAGPGRSRVLAILYSDERSQHLPNYSMLHKIFKEQIIRKDEVKSFESRLDEHYKATMQNGMTVLQGAIVEHNMLAASRIYANITFTQLGELLGIPTNKAEQLASSMIEQGRMQAAIDQVEGIVEFQSKGSSALLAWDSAIQDTCLSVNHLLEEMQKKHPQYVS